MKRVLVIGTESSGSTMLTRTLAHAMGLMDYDTWTGHTGIKKKEGEVYHLSLPTGTPSKFPNLREILPNYDKAVIIVRDNTISRISKQRRWNKDIIQAHEENLTARSMLVYTMVKADSYIFSYETFMFLGYPYLRLLYKWLGIKSDYCPKIEDGNIKYLT